MHDSFFFKWGNESQTILQNSLLQERGNESQSTIQYLWSQKQSNESQINKYASFVTSEVRWRISEYFEGFVTSRTR